MLPGEMPPKLTCSGRVQRELERGRVPCRSLTRGLQLHILSTGEQTEAHGGSGRWPDASVLTTPTPHAANQPVQAEVWLPVAALVSEPIVTGPPQPLLVHPTRTPIPALCFPCGHSGAPLTTSSEGAQDLKVTVPCPRPPGILH